MTKNFVVILELQTFIGINIFLKRFLEAMIGHWKFPECKRHPYRNIKCNNVPFRLEPLQIMTETSI